MRNAVAIVPVFNPEPGLVDLAAKLVIEFSTVVVVDDGSLENVAEFGRLPQSVVLLRHETNFGKGRAMKTAMAWVMENRTDATCVVFADGDGQHRIEDVVATANRCEETNDTVLGTRDFSQSGIPFRSRFGNVLTSFLVRAFFRFPIHDTQTGLRAIPARLLPMMLALPGERYEYEMHLFGALRHHGEALVQVPIKTIYLENNRASHFRPIVDSIKIYRGLFGGMVSLHASCGWFRPFSRMEVALSALLTAVGLLTATGFLLDVSCQGWYFWLSSAILAIVYANGSWRRGLKFGVALAVLVLATAFMFAYTTSDAQRMHAVLQRFIIAGWNPVYQCLPIDVKETVGYDCNGLVGCAARSSPRTD